MKIMVVGGSILQSYLVHEIRAQGDASLVIDMNPACHCATIADAFELCDTRDHRKALEVGHRHGVEAVITAGTDVGYTVAYVAWHLGRHGPHPGAAYNTSAKHRMRDLINFEHPVWMAPNACTHIPVMHGSPLEPDDPLQYDWERLCKSKGIAPYPCVVKPVDLSASRGINVAYTPEELSTYYWRAAALSYSGTVIIEEALGYVDGKYSPGGHREVAIDLAVIDGHPYIVNSAERIFSDTVPGKELGFVNPAFTGRPPEEIEEMAWQAAQCLNVTEGPFKMDLIFDERYGWCLLECANRWSGAFDHPVTAKIARGHNYTLDLLDYARMGHFDERLKDIHEYKPEMVCALFAPEFDVGQLITREITDLYLTSPGIIDVIKVKDTMEPWTSAAARPLFIFSAAGTKKEAWDLCLKADDYRRSVDAANNPVHYPGKEQL